MKISSIALVIWLPVVACYNIHYQHQNIFSANSSSSCKQITSISEGQCEFAQQNCHQEGIIQYTTHYYCSKYPKTLLILSVVLLAILFTTLGLTASDFLCPNLNTISKILRTNENITGLTLLAFGNGSPDLFGTYSSLKVGAGSLAIGELVGAALFITSVVVGSMAVVRPFKVIRRTFARDVIYFAVSLLVFDYFVFVKGVISNVACVALLGLYLIYVFIILIEQFIIDRRVAKRKRELKARNQFAEDGELVDQQADDEENDGDSDSYSVDETPSINDLMSNLTSRSFSFSYNPFGDYENENDGYSALSFDDDSRSGRSGSTGNSRIVNSGTYGYTTYNDVVSPGEIEVDGNLRYNIHEDNDDNNDNENSSNRFFVRPSILDAIKLNQNTKRFKKMALPTSAPPPTSAEFDTVSNSDRISLHTVDHEPMLYSSENRPATEPISSTQKVEIPPNSNSAPPRYHDNPLSHFEDEAEEQESLLHSNTDHDSDTIRNYDSVQGHTLQSTRIPSANPLTYNKLVEIFIPSLLDFKEKSLIDKTLTLLVLPLVLMLTCTVPAVQYANFRIATSQIRELRNLTLVNELTNSEEGRNQVRKILFKKRSYDDLWDEELLLTVQTFTSILILSLMIFANRPFYKSLIVPCSIVFAFLVSRMVKRCFSPSLFKDGIITKRLVSALRIKLIMYGFLSILGFAMSICWISSIAEEVVVILRFYSVVFKLSDAILGFTIFAIGNSLGDFIANLTISKMGFPRMAFAACFGGPLLNLLTGIGISGLLLLPKKALDSNKGFVIESSATLWISNLTLLLNLLFLLLAVPRSNWKVTRSIGLISIGLWVAATVINVLLEVLK